MHKNQQKLGEIMNTVEAIYENGLFRPIGKIDLQEGEKVEIIVKQSEDKDSAEDFSDIAFETGISDLAVNIDHYLYDLPKQQ